MNERLTKIVIVGPPDIGKTSIITRLNGRPVSSAIESTIGCSFVRIMTDSMALNIWDTAGQERFMSIVPLYYRCVDLILFTFDVTNAETIDQMGEYIHLFFRHRSVNEKGTKFLIIGNKIDQEHPSEASLIREIRSNRWILEYDLVNTEIMFVSALRNLHMSELLQTIVRIMESIRVPDATSTINFTPVAPKGHCCQK